MISTQGLAQLRIAATLVHGVPGLRMEVRGGEGAVAASVGWAVPSDAGSDGGPVGHAGCSADSLTLTPCAFRKAVAQAHVMHEHGRRVAFLDLGAGCDPLVEIAVPVRGAALGGGIYRVPLDGRWLFAFGTTLDATTCRTIAADLVEDALPLEMVAALGVRSDDDTGVSIVYAETAVRVAPHPSRPAPSAVSTIDDEARVVGLLQAMVARFSVEEVIRDVQSSRIHQR